MKRLITCLKWRPKSQRLMVLVTMVSVMAVSCQKEQETTTTALPRPVKVHEVADTGAVRVVEYPGQIRAVQKSWKAFEVSGRVIERLVKEGEIIKKGQVLARLDARDYQYAMDSAKAQYEAAVAVEKRITELSKKRAVSRQELDLARRDLRKSDALLKQAQKALEDTELIADFDGRVAQMLIDDFTNVVAKENVMLIQDNSLLEIVVNLPESAVALKIDGETTADKVARTNPVVILSVLPDKKYPAVYREASERPDPATRTYEVKLTFSPELDSRVRPGMTAKVRAFLPANTSTQTQGFPIPVRALVSDSGQSPFIWKVNPDMLTVSKVPVCVGDTLGDDCVVQGELKNGDLIAISGVHQLQDGQQIRVWDRSSIQP